MERSLVRSKKKSVVKTEDISGRMKSKRKTRKSGLNGEASARFSMITERAKKIRQSHPGMKWKNCIKQASKELYK